MSMASLKYLLALQVICWVLPLQAYVISGSVNMQGDWQYQIYLATIDKLDDYYGTSASSVINTGIIDEHGHFSISGENLPESPQYYRLYLIKEEHSEFNACLFVGGEEHNFIHLLLENETEVSIKHGEDTFAPFGDYTIKGDKANHGMKALSSLVYPSYIFYEIKFPSALQFSEDKLNRDLFHFADTCAHSLVALAALNNTDYDKYFQAENERYKQMGKRLQNELKDHPYTKDYFRKMRYYGDFSSEKTSYLPWYLFGLAGLGLLILWFQNIQLRRSLQRIQPETPVKQPPFTPQEMKILQLISEGHSNKEIAANLFIELSTVKSHINKLYAKMDVKNRGEAMLKAKSYQLL